MRYNLLGVVNSCIRKDTSSTTGWSLHLWLGKLLKSPSSLSFGARE